MNGWPASFSTLRELDETHGWNKGSAFRRFKRLAASAQEGRDYWVFQPHTAQFTALRSRLYPGSQRAILLGPDLAARVAGTGCDAPESPAQALSKASRRT